MRLKKYFRWELVLALSLVGCTSVVPNRLGLPQLTKDSSGASSVVTQKSSLFFQVRWPERAAYQSQEIPQEAESLEVTIKAKDGTPIDRKSIARPTNGTSVSDVVFPLDPTLKLVDVFVRALDGSGNEVAVGKVLDVRIRDNTATGVTVTLVKGSAANAQLEIDARINQQLTLLHNIQNYFSRFDHFKTYGDSPEARDVNAAVQAILEHFPFKPHNEPAPYYTPDPNYSPDPNQTPMPGDLRTASFGGFGLHTYSGGIGVRVSGTSTPVRLFNPNDSTQYMDILNGVMTNLYWPGYVLTHTYQDLGGTHTADFAVAPAAQGGDGSSADLNVAVTAGNWIPEPALTVMLDGLVNGQQATQSVTFFGGLRPDEHTLSSVKVGASVTPQGLDAKSFRLSGALDGFRDLSASPFYRLIQENMAPKVYPTGSATNYPGSATDYPGSQPVALPAYLPTHALIQAQVPSAQATSDIRVTDDLMGLQTKTQLHLKDNDGNFSDFLLELGANAKIGTVGGRSAVVSGDVGFALTDQKEFLKLEGVVHVDPATGKAVISARFVDVPSNTVIGNLDWTFDSKADPNHIAYWPELRLQDGKTYRLTPGFFSGQTTGDVRVDVR
ncbi:MAG TPA: hypothetical protein V6D05_04015 [Stenomitos sp.]